MSIMGNLATIAENVPKVYEAGKTQGQNELWEDVTAKGTRSNCAHAFRSWDTPYIRPTYKLTPTERGGSIYMFANNPSLLKVEKEYFDLSQITGVSQTVAYNGHQATFYKCYKLVEIEDVGMQAAMYDSTYYDCVSLEKIEVIRSQEDTIYNTNTFGHCSKLAHLIVEGVIGTNIWFSYCPLTVASLKSVITHLKDYSETSSEYTYTITFKATAFEALEAEGATSPHGNTWAEYIDDLKWKLTKV